MRKRSKFLTPAERNVVILLCEEFCNKRIAQFLGLATRTVETHRERIYAKTGCANLPQLVRWSVRNSIYYMPGFPYTPKHYCRHCGSELSEHEPAN